MVKILQTVCEISPSLTFNIWSWTDTRTSSRTGWKRKCIRWL